MKLPGYKAEKSLLVGRKVGRYVFLRGRSGKRPTWLVTPNVREGDTGCPACKTSLNGLKARRGHVPLPNFEKGEQVAWPVSDISEWNKIEGQGRSGHMSLLTLDLLHACINIRFRDTRCHEKKKINYLIKSLFLVNATNVDISINTQKCS